MVVLDKDFAGIKAGSRPVQLIDYIEAIEAVLGKTAINELLPLQAGDVPDTFADSMALEAATGYKPQATVKNGVKNFVDWYQFFFS